MKHHGSGIYFSMTPSLRLGLAAISSQINPNKEAKAPFYRLLVGIIAYAYYRFLNIQTAISPIILGGNYSHKYRISFPPDQSIPLSLI
jgi:hypothetical protein